MEFESALNHISNSLKVHMFGISWPFQSNEARKSLQESDANVSQAHNDLHKWCLTQRRQKVDGYNQSHWQVLQL